MAKKITDPKILLAIPFLTYLFSYLYLAEYLRTPFLFNVVIHENGKNTFLQTMFFASHFLGHVPVVTVVAFLFVGWWEALLHRVEIGLSAIKLVGSIALILSLSLLVSFRFFGLEDTLSFILQLKQSEVVYTPGGAWNLHLPSTTVLFVFVPLFLILISIWFKIKQTTNPNVKKLAVGMLLFVAVTLLLNQNIISTLTEIWKDPRYLAHSVRELVTFPLIYFPLPLYFMLKKEVLSNGGNLMLSWFLPILLFFFIVLFSYQVAVPMSVGVESLSQKPTFAHGGLGVFYLLSFHFFEHFLDSLYFTALVLLLSKSY